MSKNPLGKAATNINPVVVVMLAVGAILIYCAIQDKTPVQVFQDAFASGGGTTAPKKAAPKKAAPKKSAPKQPKR
jgi:hypothetical protein